MISNDDYPVLSHLFLRIPCDCICDGNSEMEAIYRQSVDTIFQFVLDNRDRLPNVTTNEVPQFSKLSDLLIVLRVVAGSPEKRLTREKLGYYLCPIDATKNAKVKYGENHYKLAMQLGLAIDQPDLKLTDLGLAINALPDESVKYQVIASLIFRIPCVQQLLVSACDKKISVYDYLHRYFAESTVLRRKSNLHRLIEHIDKYAKSVDLQNTILNLLWEANKDELS